MPYSFAGKIANTNDTYEQNIRYFASIKHLGAWHVLNDNAPIPSPVSKLTVGAPVGQYSFSAADVLGIGVDASEGDTIRIYAWKDQSVTLDYTLGVNGPIINMEDMDEWGYIEYILGAPGTFNELTQAIHHFKIWGDLVITNSFSSPDSDNILIGDTVGIRHISSDDEHNSLADFTDNYSNPNSGTLTPDDYSVQTFQNSTFFLSNIVKGTALYWDLPSHSPSFPFVTPDKVVDLSITRPLDVDHTFTSVGTFLIAGVVMGYADRENLGVEDTKFVRYQDMNPILAVVDFDGIDEIVSGQANYYPGEVFQIKNLTDKSSSNTSDIAQSRFEHKGNEIVDWGGFTQNPFFFIPQSISNIGNNTFELQIRWWDGVTPDSPIDENDILEGEWDFDVDISHIETIVAVQDVWTIQTPTISITGIEGTSPYPGTGITLINTSDRASWNVDSRGQYIDDSTVWVEWEKERFWQDSVFLTPYTTGTSGEWNGTLEVTGSANDVDASHTVRVYVQWWDGFQLKESIGETTYTQKVWEPPTPTFDIDDSSPVPCQLVTFDNTSQRAGWHISAGGSSSTPNGVYEKWEQVKWSVKESGEPSFTILRDWISDTEESYFDPIDFTFTKEGTHQIKMEIRWWNGFQFLEDSIIKNVNQQVWTDLNASLGINNYTHGSGFELLPNPGDTLSVTSTTDRSSWFTEPSYGPPPASSNCTDWEAENWKEDNVVVVPYDIPPSENIWQVPYDTVFTSSGSHSFLLSVRWFDGFQYQVDTQLQNITQNTWSAITPTISANDTTLIPSQIVTLNNASTRSNWHTSNGGIYDDPLEYPTFLNWEEVKWEHKKPSGGGFNVIRDFISNTEDSYYNDISFLFNESGTHQIRMTVKWWDGFQFLTAQIIQNIIQNEWTQGITDIIISDTTLYPSQTVDYDNNSDRATWHTSEGGPYVNPESVPTSGDGFPFTKWEEIQWSVKTASEISYTIIKPFTVDDENDFSVSILNYLFSESGTHSVKLEVKWWNGFSEEIDTTVETLTQLRWLQGLIDFNISDSLLYPSQVVEFSNNSDRATWHTSEGGPYVNPESVPTSGDGFPFTKWEEIQWSFKKQSESSFNIVSDYMVDDESSFSVPLSTVWDEDGTHSVKLDVKWWDGFEEQVESITKLLVQDIWTFGGATVSTTGTLLYPSQDSNFTNLSPRATWHTSEGGIYNDPSSVPVTGGPFVKWEEIQWSFKKQSEGSFNIVRPFSVDNENVYNKDITTVWSEPGIHQVKIDIRWWDGFNSITDSDIQNVTQDVWSFVGVSLSGNISEPTPSQIVTHINTSNRADWTNIFVEPSSVTSTGGPYVKYEEVEWSVKESLEPSYTIFRDFVPDVETSWTSAFNHTFNSPSIHSIKLNVKWWDGFEEQFSQNTATVDQQVWNIEPDFVWSPYHPDIGQITTFTPLVSGNTSQVFRIEYLLDETVGLIPTIETSGGGTVTDPSLYTFLGQGGEYYNVRQRVHYSDGFVDQYSESDLGLNRQLMLLFTEDIDETPSAIYTWTTDNEATAWVWSLYASSDLVPFKTANDVQSFDHIFTTTGLYRLTLDITDIDGLPPTIQNQERNFFVSLDSTPVSGSLDWECVEIEDGFSYITTPVEGKKIKDVVDILESKYGVGVIQECNALIGQIGGGQFKNYVPSVTPETSDGNFDLIITDNDGPDNITCQEFTAYLIFNVSGQTLIINKSELI